VIAGFRSGSGRKVREPYQVLVSGAPAQAGASPERGSEGAGRSPRARPPARAESREILVEYERESAGTGTDEGALVFFLVKGRFPHALRRSFRR